MCCRYHLNGRCVDSCNYRHTHVPLTAEQLAAMPGWLAKCRGRMRNPAAAGDDRGGQNKKPKLVAHNEHAYPLVSESRLHSLGLLTPSLKPILPLSHRSAAARLHATSQSPTPSPCACAPFAYVMHKSPPTARPPTPLVLTRLPTPLVSPALVPCSPPPTPVVSFRLPVPDRSRSLPMRPRRRLNPLRHGPFLPAPPHKVSTLSRSLGCFFRPPHSRTCRPIACPIC